MINILGVNIHNCGKTRIREKIDGFLRGPEPRQIATINPEFILRAQSDEEFFYILNRADLALADGIGLVLAGLCLGRFVRRSTGVWLAEELLGRQEIKKVLVINWREGLQTKAEIKAGLEKKYPGSAFLVLDSGRDKLDADQKELDSFRPELVLCVLGSPWQEKILFANKDKFASAKILVGVGGALDYICGKIRRAPKPLRRLGLEWLYRLWRQPRRAGRIYDATVRFSWLFFKWRLILPFCYRPNVAGLLYKKSQGAWFVFMVERQDQPGHWQLPQGGLGKLSIKEAGLKELREESGSDRISYAGHSGFIHKYKFPGGENRHRGANYHRFTGYKGQKQALLIAEYRGSDQDIKINYWDHRAWKWVRLEEAVKTAHETRKASLEQYVKIFQKTVIKKGP